MYELNPSESDWQDARDLLDWARNIEANGNDYLNNIKVTANLESLKLSKHLGLAVSIPQAKKNQKGWDERKAKWAKEKEERIKERAKKAKTSKWLGEVGERLTITAELVRRRYFENDWGGSYLYVFKTEDGQEASGYATAYGKFTDYMEAEDENGEVLIEEGDTVTFKGTVKQQKIYEEMKQTLLTRMAI
jgi:hypothetical protein